MDIVARVQGIRIDGIAHLRNTVERLHPSNECSAPVQSDGVS